MKIVSIDISVEAAEQLNAAPPEMLVASPLRMSRLGHVVLIAGPNGAGKTRLLRTLTQLLANRSSMASKTPQGRMNEIEALREAQAQLSPPFDDESFEVKRNGQPWTTQSKRQWQAWLAAQAKVVHSFSTVKVEPEGATSPVINFVPKVNQISDQSGFPDATKEQFAGAMGELGFNDPANRTAAYVHMTFKRAFDASHQDAEGVSPEEIEELRMAKNRLTATITSLLGIDSKPHFNARMNRVSIFGRGDYHTSLSDGQRILLHLAVAIDAQEGSLASSILFLDEPETHLHPAALIEVVDRIVAATPTGQVWIATHCVPLIAHLCDREPDCVWYAESGRISHAARTPERVINGLLGGTAGAAKLVAFSQLPARHAENQFLSECLMPPSVADIDINDPQTNQISAVIQRIKAKGDGKVRLLDYGAGRGRLLVTLSERSIGITGSWLDYYAVEPNPNLHSQLLSVLSETYPSDATQRRFLSSSEVANKKDRNCFDVVVLCNVLHEIDPNDWITEFGGASRMTQLLAPDGYMLVVEDYGLPIGELAHASGFLLLDEPELKRLFQVTEADVKAGRFLRVDHAADRYKGRLVAHLIHSSLLPKLDEQSRRNAIQELSDRMKEEIRRQKREALHSAGATSDYRAGLRYALATQLAMNALLWLEQ